MTPINLAGQFGDTTYTKVFVGGLAWETQKETMKKYFEQFGEILEAVVITDKATGRSKGYGFVTFREPDAAMRACVDAAPIIDGRRANCNLASLGVQRSKPSTPKHGGGGRNFRVMGSFQTGFGGVGSAFPSAATFPHYAIQQGIPYNVYGYSSYSPDYSYPTSYYGVYGGAAAQYPVYGSGPTGGMMTGGAAAAAAYYPYLQYGEGTGGATTGGYTSGQGYGVNYPPHVFQYSPIASTGGYAQHYGTPISLAPSPAALPSGVTMALQTTLVSSLSLSLSINSKTHQEREQQNYSERINATVCFIPSMRMRWFLSNPIKTLPNISNLRSISFRTFVPHSLSFRSRSLFTIQIPMAAIHNLSEIGLAKRFWIKFNRESIFALFTPFVISLASGNLKTDSFRHYIAQDVHFLRSFAKAYELAQECADDDDDKLGLSQLRKEVLEELKLHDSLVKEWGLDLAKEHGISSATVKYTDFLLATASGKIEGLKSSGKLATPFEKTKIAAYTLGAMSPCMRLYAFLGEKIKELPHSNESTHPYSKWIDNYSSDSFQASALQTEDLLDKLSISLTGEELDVIEKLYYQAMKLEIDFFTAQPLFQPTIVPLTKGHNPEEDHLMIFSDFDLTCTVVDSSAILAEIAIVTAPKSDNQPEDQTARMLSSDLRNTWGLLSKQYTEEYEQCIESIMPTDRLESFDYKGLSTALEQLSKFENSANNRVIESRVLKGINIEDIKRAGERLILQDGCTDFFKKVVKNESLNANVHVLSYCWCGDLIRSAFSAADLNEMDVHANEFCYEGSVSTGDIVKKVESPIDKVQAFRNILKSCNSDKKKFTIYIGDSVGDLLSLLEADVGIVVGSSSSLRTIGTQFGVSFVPLFSGLVKKQKEYNEGSSSNWKGLSGILYTVSSWAEVHAFILGC